LALAAALAGCGHNETPVAAPAPPLVPVSQPVRRQVTDYVDFTGRTDAVQSVGVRPRVTGYVVKIPFKEGTEVKKDDLLVEIDPRPYQAQLDQAKSQVQLNQAQLKLARTIYQRDVALASKSAVSQEQLDQDLAAVGEAEARVKAAKASVEVYRLNVEFTQVKSPIDGRVSRYYLTPGNLAIQDQTLLTTVVSLDPMYAYFDLDEPTLLDVRRAVNEGKIARPSRGEDVPVLMALQNEEGFPHRGTVDFVNNVVNPSTGTISVRGVFPNPLPKNGTRLISPGMFVRIRLPIGKPHDALLVIDRAVGSDQGLKFVYVVGPDNKIRYQRVKTGPVQEDGLRVITEGLKPDDWVVVGALLQVRPHMTVSPERMAMPTLSPASPDRATPAAARQPQPPPPGHQTERQGDKETGRPGDRGPAKR
jgi:multidrug efflux system membrane fusion protein